MRLSLTGKRYLQKLLTFPVDANCSHPRAQWRPAAPTLPPPRSFADPRSTRIRGAGGRAGDPVIGGRGKYETIAGRRGLGVCTPCPAAPAPRPPSPQAFA